MNGDPSLCNSTNGQNPPIQQNCRIFQAMMFMTGWRVLSIAQKKYIKKNILEEANTLRIHPSFGFGGHYASKYLVIPIQQDVQ